MSKFETMTLDLAELMQRMSAELLQCQEILRRVEHAVHEMVQSPASGAAMPDWKKNMQDLDLLDQTLGDLSACLTVTAQSVGLKRAGPLQAREILGPLRLENLRHRLNGSAGHSESADHIEIF